MTDRMMDNLERLQFSGKVRELFEMATSRGWKVKLVIWKDTGEQWELNPQGSRQTGEARRPSIRVDCRISDTGEA